MTYFEMFDIPVQLKVNTATLSQKFFALSRQFHPDYFANESSEVQNDTLEKAALLNKAWKTFQQPDATIKYVLEQKGLLEEEEKYDLPPTFLMEILEINELLMDSDDPGKREEIKSSINILENEIYEPVKKIIENYTDGNTSEKELLQVKEYYYKKKYLDRLLRELQ